MDPVAGHADGSAGIHVGSHGHGGSTPDPSTGPHLIQGGGHAGSAQLAMMGHRGWKIVHVAVMVGGGSGSCGIALTRVAVPRAGRGGTGHLMMMICPLHAAIPRHQVRRYRGDGRRTPNGTIGDIAGEGRGRGWRTWMRLTITADRRIPVVMAAAIV